MELNPAYLKLAPFYHKMKHAIDENLPDSSDTLHVFLHSRALEIVTLTTLKNLPYIAFGSHLEINDCSHFLSSRVDYLEASLMTLASFIHNFVMTFLYMGLAGLALGFSDQLNFFCYEHWQHTVFSTAFFGVAVIGILIPSLAALANFKLIESGYNVLKGNLENDRQKFEKPLIKQIQTIYEEYKGDIEDVFRASFERAVFAIDISPLKEKFNKRINEIKNLPELWELVVRIYRDWLNPGEHKLDPIFAPTPRKREELKTQK